MPQCSTVNERLKMRCREETVWGTRFCFRHYPKRGMIYCLFFGIFLGIIGISLLHFSVGNFVDHFPFFYYLDRTPPQLKSLSPDIRRLKNVDQELKLFELEAADTGSGMDWTKSRMEIKKDQGGKTAPLPGRLTVEDAVLRFQTEGGLESGNYLIEAFLADRAGRESHFIDSFTVESRDVGFTVRRFSFEKNVHGEWFEHVPELKENYPGPLMVYRMDLFHQAPENTVLRNLKVQAGFPGDILAFYEIGSSLTDRKTPFPQPPPAFWKQKNFSDHKWIEIGELDAHGMISFAVLVKCGEAEALRYAAIPFSGSYDYQSYQRFGFKHLGVWVPAVKEEKA